MVAGAQTPQPEGQDNVGAMRQDRRRMAPQTQNTSSVAIGQVCRQTSEVGAVCGKAARTVLCGGRSVMGVPTAIAYSAAPVGRFVLDVHGESESTWTASDALCTALQIINHLQDCDADYRNLDRVYIPQDALATQGLRPDALGAAKASPELRAVLQGVARRTAPLVELGGRLPAQVRDFRLCLETAVIARLAGKLNALLLERDPMSEPVHLTKSGALAWSSIGVADGLRDFSRPRRIAPPPIGGA